MALITIVFTDVVNSTPIKRHPSLGRDSRERDQTYLNTIQKPYFSMVREFLRAHQGKEIKTMGDAFFLTFEDPVQAVRCGVDIQKRLASEPVSTPLGPLQIRIGIHSGFPESFEEDWHGADVDMAARVEGAADGRQILLSPSTHELVRDMTDVKFHFHGESPLKGVGRVEIWEADWDGKGPRPTASELLAAERRRRQMAFSAAIAAVILIAGVAAYRSIGWLTRERTQKQIPGERPSVAVLEFKNLGAPGDAWLGTALEEELTTELAAGGRVRMAPGNDVAATSSDLSLAGMITVSRTVLGRIHTNLGSDYIVSGDYSSASGSENPSTRSIHVNIRLEPTESGETFSSGYDGTVDRIPGLAAQIAGDLRTKLDVRGPSMDEAQAAQAASPSNPEALQHYAEGIKKLRTLDALEARDDLEAAIRVEPNYALAHAALAQAWEFLGYDSKAEEEARIAFDDSKPLGMEDRGIIEAQYNRITHNWDRAIEIYQSLWGLNHDEPKYLLEVAQVRVDSDMGAEALKLLDALRKAEKDADKDPRIDYEEALADEQISDVKAEQSAAERAAKKASLEQSTLLAAHAYWQDCAALFALGNLRGAESACETARQKAESAAGRQVEARALTDLARIKQSEGRPTEALELHRQALAIARDIGSQRDVIGALLNLADVQSSQGRLDDSKKNEDEAIDIAKKIGDTQQILLWQNNRGVDLQTQGNYDEAKAMFQQQLATARTVGSKQAQADALQNLGVVFLQTGELEMAQQDTEQALRIARDARLKNEELGGLSSLGDIQMARGKLGDARSSYNEAVKRALQSDDEFDAANGRLGLAKLDLESGHAGAAETESKQASDTFEKFSQVDAEGDALNTLTRALMAQGKPSEAHAQLNRAAQIGVQDQVVKLSLSVTAAQLEARTGNAPQASQMLDASLADAKRMKLMKPELEIRVAQAELAASPQSGSNQPQLSAIQKEAKSAGYALIAADISRKQR